MDTEEAIAELKAYIKRNGDNGYEVLVEQLRKLKAFEADQSRRAAQPGHPRPQPSRESEVSEITMPRRRT